MLGAFAVAVLCGQLSSATVSGSLQSTTVGFFGKTEEFRETYEVSPGTKLQVVNINGDVELEEWDKNEVEVHAIKKTNHGRDELAKVRVEVVTGDVIEIRTTYLERNPRVSVDYHIKVHQGVVIQKVSTSNGDIELDGITGDPEVRTSNGDIKLKDVAGTVQVHTSNGDIEIRGRTAIRNANTSNGDVDVDIYLLPEHGTEIATSNGSIDLHIDGTVSADLRSATSMGEVSVDDIDLQSRSLARTGSSTLLKGKIGKGGAAIDAHTSNGDIRLYGIEK
jgi:DUF4097 and DUF4098 domain-containing protein YvlB